MAEHVAPSLKLLLVRTSAIGFLRFKGLSICCAAARKAACGSAGSVALRQAT
jgi:hypothetical protein